MAGNAITAMWVWDTTVGSSVTETRSLIDFCPGEGISTVFYSVQEIPDERRPGLAGFMRELRGRGISVHALFGDARWGLSARHNDALRLVESILAFNNEAAPEERFTGIQDDSEVYTLATWAFNPPGMLSEYARLVCSMSGLVSGRILPGAAVPPWFAEMLFDVLDYAAVMAYRDTAEGPDGAISISRPYVKAAAAAGSVVYVGQETQPGLVPPGISYWGRDPAYVRGELLKIHRFFAGHPGYAGIAVHRYRSYRELVGS